MGLFPGTRTPFGWVYRGTTKKTPLPVFLGGLLRDGLAGLALNNYLQYPPRSSLNVVRRTPTAPF